MIYNINIFVIGKDNFILEGVKVVAREFTTQHENYSFFIENVSPIDLMVFENRRSIVSCKNIILVTDEYKNVLTSLMPSSNFFIVTSNVKINDFVSLFTSVALSNSEKKSPKKIKMTNEHLKLRERQYCSLLYKGLSNEQISKVFQCSIKNIYYLKKKLMDKWQCKNSIQFYQCLHNFLGAEYYADLECGKSTVYYINQKTHM
ncbi:hypothetical protein EH228_05770 [Erwinia endophytica]|uniref:LuxR C-terminal-related transcriptional regulator n=1 Tax=Erwinia endophytica TaxID=1563158 RepID=UPI001265EDB2|nr:LuxR C-terminal-related transcriptional regulator [Erwinia endophytica]KAB8312817.1 hypothetical protein EH228_05770 [Erwinia endophytica]